MKEFPRKPISKNSQGLVPVTDSSIAAILENSKEKAKAYKEQLRKRKEKTRELTAIDVTL